MERVLVTGGAGYVGSVLVPKLLEDNYKVTILDNFIHENSYAGLTSRVQGKSILNHPNFEKVIYGDVRDKRVAKSALEGKDYIIHLAAIVGAPACDKNKELASSTNLEGTLNLLSLKDKNQRFIFASTGSNYGKVDGICTEESPLNPLTVYGISKTKAEGRVLEEGGVAYRFATAFGVSPRFRLDLLPNDFANRLVNQRHLDIYEADVKRTFIHVSDMTRAFIFGIENFDSMKNNAFNVGDESMNLSKRDVADKISKKVKESLGFEPYVWYNAEGEDPDKRDYHVSYKKIKGISDGFSTEVNFDEGIEELINFIPLIKFKNPFSNV